MTNKAPLVRRVLAVARQDGWAAVPRRVARRLLYTLYSANAATWYERKITAGMGGYSPPDRGIAVDDGDFEELLAWLQAGDKDYMYVEEEVSCAREHRHAFLSARQDGRILGYVKVAFEWAYVLDFKRRIRLPEGTAFMCDAYVVPEQRGRGIAPLLFRCAMSVAAERGCRALRCHVADWNQPSQRAVGKLGFVPIGVGHCRRILGYGWIRTQGFEL
jgi:ribosomal protein S18 acetylase RimI-like enzyme